MAHIPLHALPSRRIASHGVKVKACHKVRFASQLDAIKALSNTSRGRVLDDFLGLESKRQETRTYECPRCKGYHLTSLEEWVAPVRKPYPASVPKPIPASVLRTVVPSGDILNKIYGSKPLDMKA